MTPEEFEIKMKELQKNDTETSHRRMDGLMCELLEELGYEDGIQIFYDTYKWYS